MSAKTTAQQRKAPRLPPRTLIRRRTGGAAVLIAGFRRAARRRSAGGFPGQRAAGWGRARLRGQGPGVVRVVVRRLAKLPLSRGGPALFGGWYGNVGSSIYYALGVTAAFALGLTPLALILAGFIFVTTALNYAEGTAALPHAGGSSSFARRAFNQPIGFLVGWVQLLNYTATVSISAYFAIRYRGGFERSS